MTEFFETRMGHRFYEHTLPELVRQVSRLADALERMNDLQQQKDNDHDSQDERTQEDPKPSQR